ncbi:MAG: esterase/lipase family protein, partial [Thermodesulfobacteriota bacterium]
IEKMSYESARDEEILKSNIRHASEFVKKYDPNKKTVILLPGGLGSQLDRTTVPYKSNISNYEYGTVWVDEGIIFQKDALELEMDSKKRDRKEHIIVPRGPLGFFAKPYDVTESYFKENGYNYTVFGYDWRRSVEEAAIWLEDFLRRFRDGVISRFARDKSKNPLLTTTLLCHSQGGLVAKIFLHRVFQGNPSPDKVSQWIERVVTVATPFYGTSNHIKRYYKGDKALNIIYGAKRITKIAGTLPGPYILLFMDKATYERDNNVLKLDRYPFLDAIDKNIEVDPYSDEAFGRFPKWVIKDYLNQAKDSRKGLIKTLPDSVIERVFHIRSGQDKSTKVELHWQPIDGGKFDPETDEYPIGGKNGEGDGTVPLWSARLAQTPESRIYNLQAAKKHSELMEHGETLAVASYIVDKGKLPKTITDDKMKYLGTPKASSQAVESFLFGVSKNQITVKDQVATDAKIWRALMEEVALC